MTIPVDFERDSDVLFGEIVRRLTRSIIEDTPCESS